MPARDLIHYQVRTALERDGWKITSDPLFIPVEGLSGLFIDLAIENIIGIEKNGEKAAIEIKGFGEQSITQDFYIALGQVLVYENGMQDQGLNWPIYLAMPVEEFSKLEKIPLFIRIIDKYGIKILIIDIQNQKVVKWRV
jgi:hypothetical protein